MSTYHHLQKRNVVLNLSTISLLKQWLVTLSYLLAVFIGFVLMGWLMSAYAVTGIVWVGTLVVICYLAWVGSGAIALSSVWVVGILSVAAVRLLWFHDLPKPHFHFIPMVLLVNWLLALGVIWLVATTSDILKQKQMPINWLASILVSLGLIGLGSGYQLYEKTLLFFKS